MYNNNLNTSNHHHDSENSLLPTKIHPPEKAEGKKSIKAEWNNVNNREFPNKQFFQYTVDVKTELRVIIIPFNCELSLTGGGEVRTSWRGGGKEHFCSLFAIDGEKNTTRRENYIATYIFRVSHNIKTHFHSGFEGERKRETSEGERKSSKHFSFTSTKYLYSATTNKLPNKKKEERKYRAFLNWKGFMLLFSILVSMLSKA